MACMVLELVDELLLSVIAEIDDLDALRNLAQTCSRLQALAEPAIYRDVFLRTGDDASALASSIVSRPVRLQAIRTIDARPKVGREGYRLDPLTTIVRRATNLQSLTLESPFCNRIRSSVRYGWDATMAEILRPVFDFSIRRLTHLTLHLSRETERYWDVQALAFAHPTLKKLKLSCASLGDDVAETLNQRPPTPLTHLVLIECNITQNALASILALPSALEHLALGENCNHWRTQGGMSNRLYSEDPVAFFKSLKQQDHSLQSLGYATVTGPVARRSADNETAAPRSLGFDPLVCSGLSTFRHLRHISLEGCSEEFEHVLKTPQTAPPGLQRLTLMESHLDCLLRPEQKAPPPRPFLPWIPAISATIESLQRVDLIVTRMPTQRIEEALSVFKDALQQDRKLSVRMFIRRTMHAIPPFLYREGAYRDEEMGALEDGEIERIALFHAQVLEGNCIEYS